MDKYEVPYTRLSRINFTEICRLCLKKENITTFLDPKLISTYSLITNILIEEDDFLPKNICEICKMKLSEITEFIEICRYNHDYLTAVAIYEEDEQINSKVPLQNRSLQMENMPSDLGEEITHNYETNINFGSNLKTDDYSEDSKNDLSELLQYNESTELLNDKTFNSLEGIYDEMEKSIENSSKGLSDLSEHIQEYEKNKSNKWRCTECSVSFGQKRALQLHDCVYMGNLFSCSVCGRRFTNKPSLLRHINLHKILQKKKKRFECYICEKKFSRKGTLEYHMMSRHIKKVQEASRDNSDKNNHCKYCNKHFSILTYLNHHQSVHIKKTSFY